MKNETKCHEALAENAGTGRKPQSAFGIVIVHENLAAALRAKELANRLSAVSNFGVTTDVDYWKFDWLNWSPFREQAAAAAMRADLVIFSSISNDMPTLSMQLWIESWLPQKRYEWSAAVALVGAGDAIPTGARRMSQYLRSLATRAGMDFFTNAPDKPDSKHRQTLASTWWLAQIRLQLPDERLNLEAIVERSHSVSWS